MNDYGERFHLQGVYTPQMVLTLAHLAVARSLVRVANVQATGEHWVEIRIRASFQPAQKHHVILFAQTPGNDRILGVDTKPL